MRTILVCLLLVATTPSYAMVLELFGISKSGEKVLLAEGDYALQVQNKGRVVYTGLPKYGFCELAASEVEGEFLVLCSRQIGEKPNLIYKSDKDEEKKPLYRKAKAIYKRNFRGIKESENYSRDFAGYYRCIKGCQAIYADLLVKVIYRD
ncbi:MAG: hypothetical protein ABL902_02435 [Gallionella sp.]